MRRSALLLILLAGCSGGGDAARLAPEDDSQEAKICRAEAARAPEVRAASHAIWPSNETNVRRVRQEMRIAEVRAFRDCMRRRGAMVPGGVEPVRRW